MAQESGGNARETFPTTDRFELIGELGAGGMGVVYEVHDRDLKLRMALKSLQQVGPREILRLKNEFRALRDLHHVNLVRLGELFEQGGQWFFTMELVDGIDFLQWVRKDGAAGIVRIARGSAHVSDPAMATRVTPSSGSLGRPLSRDEPTMPTQAGAQALVGLAEATGGDALPRPEARERPGFDEARLRAALAGLCTGLAALHRAGMVHRDVKPSNVLVEPSGRVVLLDFGVVGELERPGATDGPREIVGTWAYMAPEQAVGHGADAAADWYAVGVMLFQALTGGLPFPPGRASLAAKMAFAPPSPDELTEDLPPDLVSLCHRLLTRDASQRPGDDEILALVGQDPGASSADPASLAAHATPFVGRGAELTQLASALVRVREGEPAWVVVSGASGVGKSTLARRFLRDAALTLPAPLVLAGRCDAREIVPYNAFDGVVDQLARALERLPAEEQARLVPPGLGALLTVFPVLRSVEAFAGAVASGGAAPADPRSAAFAALVELLRRVARSAPLVLLIDDLHRADPDSLALLRELSGCAEPPALLLLGTARPTPPGETLAALAALPPAARELSLSGLNASDAAALIALVADEPVASADAELLVHEAGGHPMFLVELTRLRARDATHQVTHLDDALWQRIQALPRDGRLLVEVIALAGTPLSPALAAQASRLAPEAFARQLAELRGARLLRIGEGRARDAVEPYHDRVRETVAARLPEPERRELHRRLAHALAGAGAPPEQCAHHFAGAGQRAVAAGYAEHAARRAAASLAFDHAADWFRTTLELGELEPARRRELLTAMGDALALSARPEAAGQAFEAALAAGTPADDERHELLRRAAEQYLKGGVAVRGFELLRTLLDTVNLAMPATTTGAIAAFAWHQLRLRSSSLRYRPRPESEVAAIDLLRADTAWTVASALAMVDSVRGAVFAIRAPLLAVRAGEPMRCARAIAGASGAASAMGQGAEAGRLLDAARVAASHCKTPLAAVYPYLAETMRCYFIENDWHAALASSERANELILAAGRTRGFEGDLVAQVSCWSLNMLGEYQQVRTRVGGAIRAAARNGDRFLETGLRTFFPIAHLMEDRTAIARADVEDALVSWQQGRNDVGNHFFFAVRSLQTIALYAGDLDDHAALLVSMWDRFWGSLMARVAGPRFEATLWGAQLGLAMAQRARRRGDERGARVALARTRKMLKIMRRSTMPVAAEFAPQIEAHLHALDGDREGALALLRASIAPLDARGMQHAVAATRWRLGEQLGGDEGAALIATARRYMTGQGWAQPARLCDALLPAWDLA